MILIITKQQLGLTHPINNTVHHIGRDPVNKRLRFFFGPKWFPTHCHILLY